MYKKFKNYLKACYKLDYSRLTECDAQFTYDLLSGLYSRNLVKYYDEGNSWMRNIVNTQDEQTHGIDYKLQIFMTNF